MEGRTSYGAAGHGSEFDFIEFIKRPQTICRLLSMLFAVVVFGCITDRGYIEPSSHCVYNKNEDACSYGVTIGVLAFLACTLFTVVDAQISNVSNSQTRRLIVMADLVFSGLWSFLWFVGFCFLCDQWRVSRTQQLQKATDNARAAIAFSFFSIFTWVALTLMAYQRYQSGDEFVNERQATNEYGVVGGNEYKQSPYASFPHPGEEDSLTSYQSQPFGAPEQPFGVPPAQPVKTEYNVPEY